MENKLTVRIRIKAGESLYSFLLRPAAKNGINFLRLINLLKKNKYLLHTGDVRRIDFFPDSAIDINKLCCITNINADQISKASFKEVIKKFKGTSKEEHCMFLTNMIRSDYYYCPQCLMEDSHIQLLWKIEGINFCIKHNSPLSLVCHHCNTCLRYKDLKSPKFCPYCHNNLTKGWRVSTNPSEEKEVFYQVWLQKCWLELIDPSMDKMFKSNEIAQRSLAEMNLERS